MRTVLCRLAHSSHPQASVDDMPFLWHKHLFPRQNIKNNFPSNPWYDKECKSLKQVLNNIAKDKKFNTRQSEYNIMLRQYKQLIQKKKRHHQEVKLSKLENMRTEHPNSYWKFWKSLKPRNSAKGLPCHNL